MKRVQVETPVNDKKLHDVKVTVELSLVELMMIKAVLGERGTNDVADLVGADYSHEAAEEVRQGQGLDYLLYEAAETIAQEELDAL